MNDNMMFCSKVKLSQEKTDSKFIVANFLLVQTPPRQKNYVIMTLPLRNDYVFFVPICMILLRSFLT